MCRVRIDPCIIILLIVGFVAFVVKCHIAYPIQYVGHADASGYAEMADSLIHGRGFEVDYISWYFIKYQNIIRPEDHWSPLYSMAIAPFFIIFGKSAFAAKLPSLIISCFFLPLILYYLTKELSRSKITSLASGLGVLLYPAFFEWSLHCLSDVIYAFVVCSFVLFSVKTIDDKMNGFISPFSKGGKGDLNNKRYAYLAGIFMGLAYYAKGSGLVLITCYILFHFITHYNLKQIRKKYRTTNIPSVKKVLTNKGFLTVLIVAFLVLLPWFIRNYVHFGDPLFSTQRFAAGYGGYVDWEIGTYDLYWGEKPPLTYSDKFKDGFGYVMEMTKEYLKTNVWWLIMDINSGWGKFGRNAFMTYIYSIPAVIGIFLMWGNKKRHLLWIVIISLLLFLSAGWFPIDRMILPLVPLMMALGWSTYHLILKTIFRLLNRSLQRAFRRCYAYLFDKATNYLPHIKCQISRIKKYVEIATEKIFKPELSAGIVICCILASVIILSSDSIQKSIKDSGYPFREADEAWIDMGRWLKANVTSDSITMTRNPWELHFYSDQLAVQIPRTSLDKTIEVMRFYNVRYIIPQLDIRPSLEPIVKGKIPGFELVYDNKKLQLYKVNYDLLFKTNMKKERSH
jgi:hypothetical protein